MSKSFVLFFCLCCISGVRAQTYTYWNDIRSSAVTALDTVWIRFENDVSDTASNSVLFRTPDGIAEHHAQPVMDGPLTFEASVPVVGPGELSVGFRTFAYRRTLRVIGIRLSRTATGAPSHFSLPNTST